MGFCQGIDLLYSSWYSYYMVAVLITQAVLAAMTLCVVVVSAIFFSRLYSRSRDAFIGFVSPAGPEKPSPMAEMIDRMAQSVAARLTQSILASFKGTASGMQQGLKGIEADIAQATLANTGNPLAIIAASLFQKQLRKNPMLAMALSQLNLGGKPGDNGGGKSTKLTSLGIET